MVHWCPIPENKVSVYGGRSKGYFGLAWRRFHMEVNW
jgi:hypothetical protein